MAMDSSKFSTTQEPRKFIDRLRSYIAHVTHRYAVLLRAIGLNFITVLDYENILHGAEAPKVLIYRSRWKILENSAVHLLPALISSLLVAMNIYGRFIGGELQGPIGADDIKLSVLQIAAKMQELLVISSLASIILHAVRRKLLYHEGIPLGLLGSHMCFTELSYFWSVDFWASVWAYDKSRRRQNFWFFSLLIVSGFIAALAGPATAILMIPRMQEWDAGGMVFWMNGSDNQLWPDRLDAQYARAYDCSTDDLRLNNYRCPSSMFTSLWFHLSTWWNYPDTSYQVTIQGYHMRKLVYVLVNAGQKKDTWSYTTHAASAALQDASVALYTRTMAFLKATGTGKWPYPERLDLARTKKFELATQIPAVRVACLTIPYHYLGATDLILPFPMLGQFESFHPQNVTTDVNVTSAVYSDLKDRGVLVGDSSGISLLPDAPSLLGIPLSVSAGDASSLGLLLLVKNAHNGLTPMTCTIDARWAKGRSVIQDDRTGQTIMAHDFVGDRSRNLISTELANDDYASTMYDFFCPNIKDASSWTHISVSPEWFRLLSPVVPDASLSLLGSSATGIAANRTLLERLLDFRGDMLDIDPVRGVRSIEVIIAMMFTDGLSRVGAYLQDNPSLLFPTWLEEEVSAPNTTVRNGPARETFPEPAVISGLPSQKMVMSAKFTGYTMALTNWFDWFSAGILLLHALIALFHTMRCLKQHETTSQAWDTIPELLALAKQSQPEPTGILENTSVGIRAVSTFQRIAIVELSGLSQRKDKETLQLNFKDTWPEERSPPTPVPDEFYGSTSTSSSARELV